MSKFRAHVKSVGTTVGEEMVRYLRHRRAGYETDGVIERRWRFALAMNAMRRADTLKGSA